MARSTTSTVILGGGIVAAGLALLAVAGSQNSTVRRLEERAMAIVSDWVHTLLVATSAHEGVYWSVQANLDGQGVSYGILQWTQRGGGLYAVLAAMRAADRAAFDAAFGGTAQADALIEHTKARNMGPLLGANLWQEPWLSGFRRAGGPVTSPTKPLPLPATKMQRAMYELAASSEYMQAAVTIAKALDVATERGLVFCYNRAVHQGVAGASAPAQKLAELYAADPSKRPAAVKDRLAQYGWLCANKFRRTAANPPQGRTLNNGMVAYNDAGTLWWKPVSEEQSELTSGGDYSTHRIPAAGVWHATGSTGTFPTLYDLITSRCSDILRSPQYRDNPVDLGAVA